MEIRLTNWVPSRLTSPQSKGCPFDGYFQLGHAPAFFLPVLEADQEQGGLVMEQGPINLRQSNSRFPLQEK